LDDDGISEGLTQACDGLVALDALGPQPIRAALAIYLGPLAARLGQLAPDTVTLDSGVELRVNYGADGSVSLCSYLQDFFGVDRVPSVGQTSAVVELWAPNGRAVQVTRDLNSFWREHYPSLRKALSRRYPKHHWPEKPLDSRAVRLKRHLGR
jgi:ATP-dependent helicase HrpB